jgi:heavy metal sensor kinase
LRLPIRARLTLVSAALMAVVLATAGILLYVRLRADLVSTVDAGLRSRADVLLSSLEGAVSAGGSLLEPEDAFAQVLGPEGDILVSSPGIERRLLLTPTEVAEVDGQEFLEKVVATAEEPVESRLLLVPVDGGVLVVGASMDEVNEALARLASLLLVGGPLALVLATGVGWFVAGAALRPVEQMRREAAAISASEPGRRLHPPATGDEIARLGETLNEMLDRLEDALQRERHFVDQASHELRTPLANLRTELELALRRSRSSAELESALRSATEETERLVRLAEDLLVLARADGGRVPVRREQVELRPLIEDATQAFAHQAADAGVQVEARVPDDLRATVDPNRMRQVIGNLLDNAIRHTPAGGRVTVEAGRVDGLLWLEVRDTGEGFPSSFVPRAFEAFARPDAARSRKDGGTGLGLAIVAAVAASHGGTAEADNGPDGGARVTVRIPG